MHEKYMFKPVATKRKRVILDTDARNFVDDQYAITHALLTPMFDLRGIIASHFGHDRIEESMEASWDELQRVLRYSGFEGKVNAVKGAPTKLHRRCEGCFGELLPLDSDGAQLIIREALDTPVGERLYIGALGPLTNIVSALIMEPRITHKIVVVWNGGNNYPSGGPEFNLTNDIAAANYLFESEVEVWQIPIKTVTYPKVSLAELQYKVMPCGEIGNYLFRQTIEFYDLLKDNPGFPPPESLDICDETIIGLLMDDQRYRYRYDNAPFINSEMYYHPCPSNRPIRIYEEIDGRYILEDLFCKLASNYR